ncbi:MAG: DnaJ domain-containing protein [Pseudomonadota bacterium]|nr:DnaJ domain-containing protein [Pseudomonadota bacterium]
MKATLYDALGILPTSTDEEVRTALRGLIRKYYTKTRDGQGNVEEALRFINHASRILSDDERRVRYDQELARSDDDEDRPSRQAVDRALLGDDEHTEVGAATGPGPGDHGIEDPLDSELPDDKADVPATHHPGLTQRVASFGRSPVLTFGLCAVFGTFIAAAIVFVTPPDIVVVARSVLGWLTVIFLLLAGVYAIVHGIVFLRRRQASARSGLVPQTDLAILNWRRERSVFLGTNQPQEDASWIFQLRMAELERAKSGRTSEPRPWHRLAARMFDYAIWGLLLALLLSQLRALGVIPERWAHWLAHPLLAPILITLSWVPIEALLITSVGTTPGKWLFGIYLQFSISDAYASRNTRTQLIRGFSRAMRVWFRGVGCGFPLLAPILVAVAHERLALHQETEWDFAEDCLVTHGPAGVVNTVTGVCGLASMIWLYGVAWQQPMADTLAWMNASVAAALPSPGSVKAKWTNASGEVGRLLPALPALSSASDFLHLPRSAHMGGQAGTASAASGAQDGRPDQQPSDAEFTAMMAARRARIDLLKFEGPRMLRAGNARRAVELCRGWADLELANPEAWRCLGSAQQAAGEHQEALNSFRKARQHDPYDRSLDVAIESAQRGIVSDFLNRYRR